MKRYLVGGAVRDKLLGRPVTERDWLVTGVSEEQLQALGYRKVGKDFAVFLHPETAEEHALPRGGRGTDELEQVNADLALRDLTINAIAETADGTLIDPLGGARDIRERLLRHTPAFGKDPIRALRLARLAARYAHLGFRIARETRILVREMALDGRMDGLVPERVWAEISRALAGPEPRIFIEALRDLGLLAVLLPELERLFGVPQPPKHHPEIDTGLHTLLALERASRLSESGEVRFAVLLHDLGKGLTPEAEWPSHIAHEKRGLPLIREICNRLKVPGSYRDLALLSAEFHTHCHRALELRPATLLRTLSRLDALRRPERFREFLIVCQADAQGRTGLEERDYPQARFFTGARDAALSVDAAEIARKTADPARLPEQLKRARKHAIAAFKAAWGQTEPPC